MHWFLFTVFAAVAFSACPTQLPINFMSSDCESSVLFSPFVEEEVCYNKPFSTNACDPSCCDGVSLDECTACTSSPTSGSFFLSNGSALFYIGANCTGAVLPIEACSVGVFFVCNNEQVNMATALNDSLCVDDLSTSTTGTTSGTGSTSGASGTTSTFGTSATTSGTTSGDVSSAPPQNLASACAELMGIF